jgi:hypothetical protein
MNQIPGVVEVFKTDIGKKKVARALVKSLSLQFPDYKINIDLADNEKVLRIESAGLFDVDQIVRFAESRNIKIELLS